MLKNTGDALYFSSRLSPTKFVLHTDRNNRSTFKHVGNTTHYFAEKKLSQIFEKGYSDRATCICFMQKRQLLMNKKKKQKRIKPENSRVKILV